MATIIPVAANDARNAAFQSLGGDKNAYKKMGNKWAHIAKNPGKSAWNSFKSIFGFGLVPCPAKRGRGKAKKKKVSSLSLASSTMSSRVVSPNKKLYPVNTNNIQFYDIDRMRI